MTTNYSNYNTNNGFRRKQFFRNQRYNLHSTMDNFIQSSLDKFEYEEYPDHLINIDERLKDMLTSKSPLTPDLVIFNETFNKNLCFLDSSSTNAYQAFPRVKFIVNAVNNTAKYNDNQETLEDGNDNNNFGEEEDPQWKDINVNDMDTMKFQALPKLGTDGMNTAEDILGHLEDLSSNEKARRLTRQESEKIEELKQLLKDSKESKQEIKKSESTSEENKKEKNLMPQDLIKQLESFFKQSSNPTFDSNTNKNIDINMEEHNNDFSNLSIFNREKENNSAQQTIFKVDERENTRGRLDSLKFDDEEENNSPRDQRSSLQNQQVLNESNNNKTNQPNSKNNTMGAIPSLFNKGNDEQKEEKGFSNDTFQDFFNKMKQLKEVAEQKPNPSPFSPNSNNNLNFNNIFSTKENQFEKQEPKMQTHQRNQMNMNPMSSMNSMNPMNPMNQMNPINSINQNNSMNPINQMPNNNFFNQEFPNHMKEIIPQNIDKSFIPNSQDVFSPNSNPSPISFNRPVQINARTLFPQEISNQMNYNNNKFNNSSIQPEFLNNQVSYNNKFSNPKISSNNSNNNSINNINNNNQPEDGEEAIFLENPIQLIAKNIVIKGWYVSENEKIIDFFNSADLFGFLNYELKNGRNINNYWITDIETDIYFKPDNLYENLKESIPKLIEFENIRKLKNLNPISSSSNNKQNPNVRPQFIVPQKNNMMYMNNEEYFQDNYHYEHPNSQFYLNANPYPIKDNNMFNYNDLNHQKEINSNSSNVLNEDVSTHRNKFSKINNQFLKNQPQFIPNNNMFNSTNNHPYYNNPNLEIGPSQPSNLSNFPPFSKNLLNKRSPQSQVSQFEQPMMYNNYNRNDINPMNFNQAEDPNLQYLDHDGNNFNNDFITNKVNLNSRMESYNNRVMIRNQVQNQNFKPTPNNNPQFYY